MRPGDIMDEAGNVTFDGYSIMRTSELENALINLGIDKKDFDNAVGLAHPYYVWDLPQTEFRRTDVGDSSPGIVTTDEIIPPLDYKTEKP